MLALEIRINGELKGTCGTEDVEWLAASLMAKTKPATSPKDSVFQLQCVGARNIDADTREVLKWLETRVKFGDEVSFRFVDATQVLEPMDRQAIAVKAESPDA